MYKTKEDQIKSSLASGNACEQKQKRNNGHQHEVRILQSLCYSRLLRTEENREHSNLNHDSMVSFEGFSP
jgi:hypothetical protein